MSATDRLWVRAPAARSRWHGERTRPVPSAPSRPARRPPERLVTELLRARRWHTRIEG